MQAPCMKQSSSGTIFFELAAQSKIVIKKETFKRFISPVGNSGKTDLVPGQ